MKKIMFNDLYGLTEAVLSGRKTQTRRIIPQPFNEKIIAFKHQYFEATFELLKGIDLLNQYFFVEKIGKLPYQIGEVVAVAQSYKDAGFDPNMPQTTYVKERGWVDLKISKLPGWKNKMLTFPTMMPHQIRITNVRVERLNDISDADCMDEGVEVCTDLDYSTYPPCLATVSFDIVKEIRGSVKRMRFETSQEAYAALIDDLCGKGTWDNNPYVFVYDFELIKQIE